MKSLHRRPLLKTIAIAGLSIGSVGSLVSCSASGGESGEGSEVSDNATVEEDSDTAIGAAENENNSLNADLIIDTTDSNYSALANPDGSLAFNGVNGIPSPGILVHRTSQYLVNVVSRYCTHFGCTVGSNYVCACHNSQFDKDGSVLRGPASIPLKTYSATVSGDSILINFA